MAAETTSPVPSVFLGDLIPEDAVWFLGERTWSRATAHQTDGALGLLEPVLEPGFASPHHLHGQEEEAFIVLKGAVHFFSDIQT